MSAKHAIRCLALAWLALVSTALLAQQPAPGSVLGTSFIPVPGGDNFASRVLVQPDGRIVLAGTAQFGVDRLALTRYHPDGSLDTSFGSGGTVLRSPSGAAGAQAHAIAMQPDGKLLVAGQRMIGNIPQFLVARFHASGAIDLSFGNEGFASPIPGQSEAFAVVLQPDGRIVAGGYSIPSFNRRQLTLVRFNADGSLDGSFGTGGIVTSGPAVNHEAIRAMALQADGKIVAVGDGEGYVALRRFQPSGAVDLSWGSASNSSMFAGRGVAIQPDGRVLVVGSVPGGAITEVGVLRLTSGGNLDNGFGSGTCAMGPCPAVTTMSIGGDAFGRDLVLQPDGMIVVTAGVAFGGGGTGVGIGRFRSDGSIDTSFGSSGKATFHIASGEGGSGLARRADGRFVVAGSARGAHGDLDSLAVAFTVNGTLDTSFNAIGFARLDVGSAVATIRDSAFRPDGKLVVAGSTTSTPRFPGELLREGGFLLRFLADGSLDTSFAANGIARFDWPARAVALQPDGRIVIAGFALTDQGGSDVPSMAFARYLPDGTPDGTFGSGGRTVVAPVTSGEQVNDIALQADGRIVGAGSRRVGIFFDSVVVRLTASGALDTTFSGDGVAVVAMSDDTDTLEAVRVQADGRIVAAGMARGTDKVERMAAVRLEANGALDAAFGNGGVVTVAFGGFFSRANDLAIRADGRIVLAGSVRMATGGNFPADNFALAQLLPDGSADTAFGNGGIAFHEIPGDNRLLAIALLPGGKLAAAAFDREALAAAQFLANGALDAGFGSGGWTRLEAGIGSASPHSIAVAADGTLFVSGRVLGLAALVRVAGEAPPSQPPRLGNISTRGQVGTGNDVLIGGFVIGGTASKTVVVRARGPSLAPFGITNTLGNPQLQLVRSSDQATIATNDDWGTAANASQLSTSGFAPSEPLEAAVMTTLPPGAYTAIVSGVGGGTGVAIVEVFEVDAFEAPLVNISTRGQVLPGNDVLIGGLVIQGSGPRTVAVRARGPSLAAFGIANALANPQLQLVRSSDQLTLVANDNWRSHANAAELQASGFAPADDLEAAVLVTLDPGAYTVIVSGVGGTTGVGIVEVFAVP